jgi:hypothetical protein
MTDKISLTAGLFVRHKKKVFGTHFSSEKLNNLLLCQSIASHINEFSKLQRPGLNIVHVNVK